MRYKFCYVYILHRLGLVSSSLFRFSEARPILQSALHASPSEINQTNIILSFLIEQIIINLLNIRLCPYHMPKFVSVKFAVLISIRFSDFFFQFVVWKVWEEVFHFLMTHMSIAIFVNLYFNIYNNILYSLVTDS